MSRNVRKRTFWHVLPTKIQISLRIRAVWSESSLSAFWIVKDAKFLHADNKDWSESGYEGSSQSAFYVNLYRGVIGPSG